MMTESNRIEFKQELTDGIEKVVISFLNYREGGIIYLGIDKNGNIVGLQDSDSIQLKIKDRLKNNIQPSCLGLFDVINQQQKGKNIIKIIMASGSEKPYYLKKYGMTEKGCYIRIGSASEPMPIKMIEDLFSKRTRNSIGKIVSNRQDLTFEQLNIYYQAKGLKLNDKFANTLELLTREDKFNYVAYLMADENGTSIKVAKYSGTDRVDLTETNEYGYCSLIKATKQVLDKLELENRTTTKITSKERKDQRLWDAIAVREAVINAIVHNDYTREVPPKFEIFSDRLEITSAGSLPEGMTEDEFFEGYSIPRNKEIMRIYKDLEMVEHLGSGIPRILQSYSKDDFKFTANFLRMSFKSIEPVYGDDPIGDPIGGPIGGAIGGAMEDFIVRQKNRLVDRLVEGLVESQKKIVILISKNPQITKKEMSRLIGISTTSIDKNIAILKKSTIIQRVGSDASGYWKVILKPKNIFNTKKDEDSSKRDLKYGLVEGLVEGLADTKKKIVILVSENPQISKKEMSEQIGISTTAIDKNIAALKKENIIERVGSDNKGYWKLIEK